jgi:hypothetical protein
LSFPISASREIEELESTPEKEAEEVARVYAWAELVCKLTGLQSQIAEQRAIPAGFDVSLTTLKNQVLCFQAFAGANSVV